MTIAKVLTPIKSIRKNAWIIERVYLLKRLIDIKSVIIGIIIIAALIYYLKETLEKGQIVIHNQSLFCAFMVLIVWTVAYLFSESIKGAEMRGEAGGGYGKDRQA